MTPLGKNMKYGNNLIFDNIYIIDKNSNNNPKNKFIRFKLVKHLGFGAQ
jgi:hypothetical protein